MNNNGKNEQSLGDFFLIEYHGNDASKYILLSAAPVILGNFYFTLALHFTSSYTHIVVICWKYRVFGNSC